MKTFGCTFINVSVSKCSSEYAIPKIEMLGNLRCVKARLRLLCIELLTARQLEPRFKTAKVRQHYYFWTDVYVKTFECTFENVSVSKCSIEYVKTF